MSTIETLSREAAAASDARIATAKALAAGRTAAVTRFTVLRLEAEAILRQAANLPGLPELLRQQGLAAAALAGNRFHRVQGEATGEDAAALSCDVDMIAGAIDPLLAAIGREAQDAFGGIDQSYFTSAVHDALSDASGALAAKVDGDDDTPSVDPDREHRTHPGRG